MNKLKNQVGELLTREQMKSISGGNQICYCSPNCWVLTLDSASCQSVCTGMSDNCNEATD